MSTSNCVFCEILAGRAEGSVVYRDDQCAAFMDIQPINAGHVLVVPTRHASSLADLRPEEWASVMETGRRIGAALRRSEVACEGVNLLLADGAVAGQEVFHCHLHVIPRVSADGFGFRFPKSYFELPSRSELEEVAADLRAAVSSGG